MNVGGIGSNNYYLGQMSAMRSRSASAGMSGQTASQGPMGNPPDPSEMFAKVDQDGSGGLDQTEFQVLADKIGEATGESVDVEELFSTYDTDGDGVLSEEETQTAMDANRPEGPPPGGMGGMGGMQGPPPPDSSQMFSDADEDGDGSLDETEAQTLADMISGATGEEMDAADLIAAYDEDGDGVLSEAEAEAALEANRPEGPPPGDMTAESRETQSGTTFAIDSYMKMAALGMGAEQGSNPFAMFDASENAFGAGGFFAVNTHA